MSDQPKNILVCESNGALAGMIATGLSKAGFVCTVVEDGRDAWDKLENAPFDAVITEYELKDSLGTEICRGLRQHKQLSSTPLFVTTGADDATRKAMQDELNPEGLVKKPLSVKKLVADLESVLGGESAAPAEPAAEPEPPAAEEPAADAAPDAAEPAADASPEAPASDDAPS